MDKHRARNETQHRDMAVSDLKRRGLAIGDEALGFWAALREVIITRH